MAELTESELTLRGLGYVRVVNELLEFFAIPHRVYLVEDINYDVFVALYERLVDQSLIEVFGLNPNRQEQVKNLQMIIEALSNVLGVQLDHIRASAIVNEKDRTAICNLVEIIEFAASLFPGTFTNDPDFWKSHSRNTDQRTEQKVLIEQEPIVEPLDRSAVLRSKLLQFLTTNRDALNELERYRIGQRSVASTTRAEPRQRPSRATQRNEASAAARPQLRPRPRSADSNASRRTFTIESGDDHISPKTKQKLTVKSSVTQKRRTTQQTSASVAKKAQTVRRSGAATPAAQASRIASSEHGRVRTRSTKDTPVTRLRSKSSDAKQATARNMASMVEGMYNDRLKDLRQELALNLDARRARLQEKASDYEKLKHIDRAHSQRARSVCASASSARPAKNGPVVTAQRSAARNTARTVSGDRREQRPTKGIRFGDEQHEPVHTDENVNPEGADDELARGSLDGNPWKLLEDEFPDLHVSSELVNRLYAKYVDLLQSASRQLRSTSASRAAKTRVRDAVERYRRFLESVETGLRSETRRAELVDARRMQIAQRNALTQKRIESIRLRRYFSDYYLRIRAEFARHKADFDETLFRRFFVQLIAKYRRELASFVRSRRDMLHQRTERVANVNEARDAFYGNEAQLALDKFRSQRSALETNERTYRVELATLKRSLQDRMRGDIERMQNALRVELGQVAQHFREADVERILSS